MSKRTELDQLLQIFAQDDTHKKQLKQLLNISAEDIPLQYQAIVRRLRLAIADTHTRNLMQAEDEIIGEFRQ